MREIGDHVSALSDYQKAAQYGYPQTHLPLFGQALTYELLNRPLSAEKLLQQTLELKPDFQPARDKLALLRNAGAMEICAQLSRTGAGLGVGQYAIRLRVDDEPHRSDRDGFAYTIRSRSSRSQSPCSEARAATLSSPRCSGAGGGCSRQIPESSEHYVLADTRFHFTGLHRDGQDKVRKNSGQGAASRGRAAGRGGRCADRTGIGTGRIQDASHRTSTSRCSSGSSKVLPR